MFNGFIFVSFREMPFLELDTVLILYTRYRVVSGNLFIHSRKRSQNNDRMRENLIEAEIEV